jgi:hypothetical protein
MKTGLAKSEGEKREIGNGDRTCCCEHCAELLRRVGALEEMVFRKHAVRKTVLRIIASWPGPFTPQQIFDAVKVFAPDQAAGMKQHAIDGTLRQLERDGVLDRSVEGNGRNASVFEVIGDVPDGCGRPGPKYGRKATYESGFRNILRAALAELPKEFRLDDLKKWLVEKMPSAQIPYGSLSSTLYKLEQSNELVVVKRAHYLRGKIYTRGPKHVTPTGEEMRELEQAWQEFRSGMKIETPEIETSLERGEEPS